jgi:hypothetical protein
MIAQEVTTKYNAIITPWYFLPCTDPKVAFSRQ